MSDIQTNTVQRPSKGAAGSPVELSEAMIKALREKASEKVRAELQKAAEDQLFKKLLVEERQKFDPNEEMVEIAINLPKFLDSIKVDNTTIYWHGVTYHLPMRKFLSVRDTIQWAWRQERSTSGENVETEYRKQQRTRLGR